MENEQQNITFWDIYQEICFINGVPPVKTAKTIGLSTGTIAGWKNGATPQVSTIVKIEDYFSIERKGLVGIVQAFLSNQVNKDKDSQWRQTLRNIFPMASGAVVEEDIKLLNEQEVGELKTRIEAIRLMLNEIENLLNNKE